MASPALERGRWGILVQRTNLRAKVTGAPYLGIAGPPVVLKLALVQPGLKVEGGGLAWLLGQSG